MQQLSFFHFFCISVHPFSVVIRRGFFLGSSLASGFEGSGLKSESEDRFY